MIQRQEKNKIGNKFCDSVKLLMAMAFCGINNTQKGHLQR